MKIAMISEHASPLAAVGGVDAGGQNVYVGQVARHLAALGHTVDVFTRRDRADLPETVDWAPRVRVVHVPAGPAAFLPKEEMLPCMASFTRRMLERMRREPRPYDLLHANFFMSGLAAADIKEATGIPFVVTFHALGRVRMQHQKEADKFPRERLDIEDRLVAEADMLIAECPQDRDDLVRHYRADPGKISVVPCGFDPAEFWPVPKEAARSALGLPAETPLILQLGRLVPRKGIDTVIRGFARFLKESGRAARLLIVGGDAEDPGQCASPELERLRGIAREEGAEESVIFTGSRRREALRLYYSAADLFVTMPWYEPFGITPLEAMACGTPVLGAQVGGIQYSVLDGETGFLVPPKDPDALARRMSWLYRAPELMEEMGRKAIRRVNETFTWEKVADALSSLYREIAGAAIPLQSFLAAPKSPAGTGTARRGPNKPPPQPVKAAFLDKDGTLIEDFPFNTDPDRIRLMPGALEGLRRLRDLGHRLVVVSNQSGVARGYFPAGALKGVEERIRALLKEAGLALDGFYFCPHHPEGSVPAYAVECACRKPAPGMLLRAAGELNIDLASSWMIGDISDDVEAGDRAGCRTVLIDNGRETVNACGSGRRPHLAAPDLSEAARLIEAESIPLPAAKRGRRP